MKRGRPIAAAAFAGGLIVVLLLMATVDTAANTVPVTKAGRLVVSTGVDETLPQLCGAMNPSALVTGSGSFDGRGENELNLGSADADTINGKGGADCIVGGAGNDRLTGGGGKDICIGGAGNDTFSGCETSYQ